MPKKSKIINEKKVYAAYEAGHISIRDLAQKMGISQERIPVILRKYKSKRYLKKKCHGSKTPWNKGRTKYNDARINRSVKKMSTAHLKTGVRDGYPTIWSEELNKRVKQHLYVWWKNTGYWPNAKRGDQIHHIDNDKTNNDFNNLTITSVSVHSAIHKQYEQIFVKLLKLGILRFDKKIGGVDWQSYEEMVKKLKA